MAVQAGNDAVPGLLWPGYAQPGYPYVPVASSGTTSVPGISTVLGGNDAVPGYMWTGYAVPGQPVINASSGGGTASYNYSGPQAALFPQYFDVLTGKPLFAQPGSSYTMIAVNAILYPQIPPNDDADWH